MLVPSVPVSLNVFGRWMMDDHVIRSPWTFGRIVVKRSLSRECARIYGSLLVLAFVFLVVATVAVTLV